MPLDTESYLTAQGWKGKGTALKEGHATRPIATVQKRNLTGVGKDRDEAVPFWDNIFASAALNIKISSTPIPSPSTSGTSTPNPTPTPTSTPRPNQTVPSIQPKTDAPISSSSSSNSGMKLNPHVRAKREMVRRRLYSGFSRGVILKEQKEDQEVEEEERTKTDVPAKETRMDFISTTPSNQAVENAASSSSAIPSITSEQGISIKTKRRSSPEEAEEKAARRAARALRREKKEKGSGALGKKIRERRVVPEVGKESLERIVIRETKELGKGVSKEREKGKKRDFEAAEPVTAETSETGGIGLPKKKRKKLKKESHMENGISEEPNATSTTRALEISSQPESTKLERSKRGKTDKEEKKRKRSEEEVNEKGETDSADIVGLTGEKGGNKKRKTGKEGS